MASYLENSTKITTKNLAQFKAQGQKITMLTAYDFTMASMLDQAGIELILVGDSAANVVAGHSTTIPITLEQIIYHAQCVMRGAKRALVVVDLPFGSYPSPDGALHSATRIFKETQAHAVKLEGGKEQTNTIELLVKSGIPVMGHLGLTPQHINQLGGYQTRAKEQKEAEKLISDALALQDAGCFALVLEKIPAPLAKKVSQLLEISTIGIGAGVDTDGQVLVVNDMLGMTADFSPKFVRKYLNLNEVITTAVKKYIQEVKEKSFPSPEESY